MNAVATKSTVAAITGLFGSLGAVFYGYGNLVPIAGIGLFLFTLLVQYGALKIKFLIPMGAGLSMLLVLSQRVFSI